MVIGSFEEEKENLRSNSKRKCKTLKVYQVLQEKWRGIF
jgi:hypothetical protein